METTYAGILGALAQLDAALEANAAELGHLDGARQRFADKLSELQEAAQEQAALTARKQEASRRVLRLLTETRRAATGIRTLLKEFYGISAEKLTEYGIQPFRGRFRRAEADGPETPEPTPPPVIE